MNLEYFRELYSFNRWANQKTLAAVSELDGEQLTRDLGNSFPSIQDTLVHIMAAEWIWLERWKGNSPDALPDSLTFSDLAEVRKGWKEIEQGQVRLLEGLTEESLLEELAYINTSGERWTYPLWQMLAHLVNHSSYHRGQIVTMLRQVGAQPPATDFLMYYDEVGES